MSLIPVTELSDPRLADYSHQTDVALRKAQGTEHGLYLAEPEEEKEMFSLQREILLGFALAERSR